MPISLAINTANVHTPELDALRALHYGNYATLHEHQGGEYLKGGAYIKYTYQATSPASNYIDLPPTLFNDPDRRVVYALVLELSRLGLLDTVKHSAAELLRSLLATRIAADPDPCSILHLYMADLVGSHATEQSAQWHAALEDPSAFPDLGVDTFFDLAPSIATDMLIKWSGWTPERIALLFGTAVQEDYAKGRWPHTIFATTAQRSGDSLPTDAWICLWQNRTLSHDARLWLIKALKNIASSYPDRLYHILRASTPTMPRKYRTAVLDILLDIVDINAPSFKSTVEFLKTIYEFWPMQAADWAQIAARWDSLPSASQRALVVAPSLPLTVALLMATDPEASKSLAYSGPIIHAELRAALLKVTPQPNVLVRIRAFCEPQELPDLDTLLASTPTGLLQAAAAKIDLTIEPSMEVVSQALATLDHAQKAVIIAAFPKLFAARTHRSAGL